MRVHYKWLLTGLVLVLVLFAMAIAKPTTSQKQSIVQLFVVNSANEWLSSGSGTLIYDSHHILTNYHVVEEAVKNSSYQILVCFNLDETEPPYCLAKAKLLPAKASGQSQTYEEIYDLAILEITKGVTQDGDEKFDEYQKKYNLYLPQIEIDTTNESRFPVETGDTVEILGYPAAGGKTMTYSEGKVSGFEKDGLKSYIKTDALMNPGLSGGGAFDTQHNFIGVPSAGVADIGGTVGYIIALPTVNAFLSQITLRYCHSYDDNNRCVCKYGYKADSTGTKCIRDTAIKRIDDETVKPLPESQQYLYCDENMTLNPTDGLCYANEGYMWSDAKNGYVTYTEMCQENYGEYAYSKGEATEDGSTYCYCKEGYTWNSAGTGCVRVRSESATDSGRQSVTGQDSFLDVSSIHPYFAAIGFVKQNGIVSGYEDGSFKPDNKINRAEFTKILVQAAFPAEIESYSQKACFKDFDDSAWFAKYVCLAKEKGVISGYSDNTFRPDKNINVAEALKITLEALYGNIPATTGAWYQKYLDFANAKGVMLNVWSDINKEITRGEMAELIYRIKQS